MTDTLIAPPVQRLFGIPIAAVTLPEATELVHDAIAHGRHLHIGVVNAAKLVNMRRQPALHAAVVACDVIFADGMAVVWASRLLGVPLPERVAGIDLMEAMLARGNDLGWRVYCLGAAPEVLRAAVAALAAKYPGIDFVGAHHGYFADADEPALVAEIAALRPHVLLVGITSPRKEVFLARWQDTLGVQVCHGVGGSFDVAAGKARRAPVLWQRAGIEWLYRVIQEPRRMWRRYLVTNTWFMQMVAAALVRRALRRPERNWGGA